MRGITEDEKALVDHVTRYGSDGYPVAKLTDHRKRTRGWTVGPWRSVTGPPCVFKTKRAAVAHFEAFHAILLDALAGRI